MSNISPSALPRGGWIKPFMLHRKPTVAIYVMNKGINWKKYIKWIHIKDKYSSM